jgi:hypothetical protein
MELGFVLEHWHTDMSLTSTDNKLNGVGKQPDIFAAKMLL